MTEAERRGKAKAAMTSNPNILVICNAYVGHAAARRTFPNV